MYPDIHRTSGHIGTLPISGLADRWEPQLVSARPLSMRYLTITLTFVSLVLAACTPMEPPTTGAPGGPGPVETPNLTGTRWLLTQYGDPAAPQTPLAETEPILSFDREGQLGHTTGCNGLGGEYTLNGADFKVGNLIQTEMACDAPLMTQESTIGKALQSATSLAQTDDALTIAYPEGELRYTRQAEPEPASLIGPEWKLETITSGDIAQSTVAGTTVTLTFTSDSLSGNAGCNGYNAGWSGDESALTIQAVASTKMACADQAANDQEVLYLSRLQAATSYAIDGNQLTLTGPEGTLVFLTTP